MRITVSKRNCFGAALAVGTGLVVSKIVGVVLIGGAMYGWQALVS